MVWNGKGTERFIRPIRWLVALLGDAVVPFEIGGVKSGNTTVGHRVFGKPSIPVTIAEFRANNLRANGVILSATERRDKIEAGISVQDQARSGSAAHLGLHNRVPYPDSRQL